MINKKETKERTIARRVKHGTVGEEFIKKLLKARIDHQSAWDIVTKDNEKIEVKQSSLFLEAVRSNKPLWKFHFYDKQRLYSHKIALVCLNDKNRVTRVYLIPTYEVRVSTLSLGKVNQQKYAQYQAVI